MAGGAGQQRLHVVLVHVALGRALGQHLDFVAVLAERVDDRVEVAVEAAVTEDDQDLHAAGARGRDAGAGSGAGSDRQQTPPPDSVTVAILSRDAAPRTSPRASRPPARPPRRSASTTVDRLGAGLAAFRPSRVDVGAAQLEGALQPGSDRDPASRARSCPERQGGRGVAPARRASCAVHGVAGLGPIDTRQARDQLARRAPSPSAPAPRSQTTQPGERRSSSSSTPLRSSASSASPAAGAAPACPAIRRREGGLRRRPCW